jgi:hypothetical protein
LAVIFCFFGLKAQRALLVTFVARDKSNVLWRFPKSLSGLERRGILTAAPSSPRFIRHRRHFGDDATRLEREKTNYFSKTKNKSTNYQFRQGRTNRL